MVLDVTPGSSGMKPELGPAEAEALIGVMDPANCRTGGKR